MLDATSETANVSISVETRERAAVVTGAERRAVRNPGHANGTVVR